MLGRTRPEQNYKRIVSLVPGIETAGAGSTWRLKSSHYMDLVVEVLQREGDKSSISLAHYYKMNGDLVCDPDMEVDLFHAFGMADATSFEMGGFRRVDSYAYKDGVRVGVYPNAKKDNNAFLAKWLVNLKNQGHRVVESKAAEEE